MGRLSAGDWLSPGNKLCSVHIVGIDDLLPLTVTAYFMAFGVAWLGPAGNQRLAILSLSLLGLPLSICKHCM